MPQDKIVKKDRDGFHGAIYRPESHGKLTDEKLKKVKKKGYKEYSQDEYQKKLDQFKGKKSKQIDQRADEVASKKKSKATRTGLLLGGAAGTVGAVAGKGRAGLIAAAVPTALGTGIGYAVGKKKEKKIKNRADKIKNYINQDIDISGEGRRYFYKESEAKSKSQKRLMSMAHGVKKGDLDPQELNPSLRKKVMEIADSMSKEQIEDYSRTSSKGLPEKTASNAYNLERLRRLANIFPKETKKVVDYAKKNNDTGDLLSQVAKLEEKAVRSGKAEIVNHKALGKPLLKKKANINKDSKMEKKAQPNNRKSLKDMDEQEKMRVLQKHIQQHNSRVQNSIDSRNSAVNKKLMEETGKWSGIGAASGGALGAGFAKLLSKAPLKGGLAGAAAGGAGLGGLALYDLYPKAQKYKVNDQQEAAIMKGLNKRHVQAAEQLQKNGSANKLKTQEDISNLLG